MFVDFPLEKILLGISNIEDDREKQFKAGIKNSSKSPIALIGDTKLLGLGGWGESILQATGSMVH